jgi:hypothetical protein
MSALSQINNDISNLLVMLTKHSPTFPNVKMPPGMNLEIEIRIKGYTDRGMKGGISFRQFNQVQKYFESIGVEPSITESKDDSQSIPSNFRKASLRRQISTTSGEEWNKKFTLDPIDNPNLNMRYSISFEQIVVEPKEFISTNTRMKERYSYPYLKFYRVDLTKIDGGKSFELELEVVNWNNVPNRGKPYKDLPRALEELLKVVHDTNVVYTVNQYLDIVNFFNRTMVNTRSHRQRSHNNWNLNHKALFQPRNINIRDMVSGGLTRNEHYSYNITVKADGVRKLLVIHSSGVWLLMGPGQANLVVVPERDSLDSISSFNGVIMEGELIPMENRTIGFHGRIVSSKYWFMVFDCLSRPSNLDPNSGDRSVQKLTHVNRLKYAHDAERPLNEAYAPDILMVGVKEFKGFDTATQLFDAVRRMENLKSTNYYGYLDDGYIFTPNQMPYDCRTTYYNRQTIEIYWRKTALNRWDNGTGSIIQLEKKQLFQYFQDNDSQFPPPNRLETSDTIWYTDKVNTWVQGRNGVWNSVDDPKWFTSNPVTSNRNELKGARMAEERNNTLKIVSGGLLQTIDLVENSKGSVPIHKIPLHLRKLTRYPDICKWKPPKDLTIDFTTIRHGEFIELLVSGFNDELIPFSGNKRFPFVTDPKREPYGPVDYDNPITANLVDRVTIVEYEWDFINRIMIPRKIRKEKTRPNQLGIASAIWSDIQNPIDLRTLTGNTFTFMSRYHNRIKWKLFNEAYKELKPNPTLLDIGSGRGGDILKWKNAGRIVAVEPNPDHIKELINRIGSSLRQIEVIIVHNDDSDAEITNKLDTADERGDQIVIIQTGGENTELINSVVNHWLAGPAKLISMMLSMSFFWQNEEMVQSLADTILRNLDPKVGRAIFFTIDGRMVRHAFEPMGLEDDTIIGGQIEKYDELKLGDATLKYERDPTQSSNSRGSQIGVDRLYINIPDSIVIDQEEWLVYLDDLSERLGPGFKLSSTIRADREPFMSTGEYRLSNMYTGGHIYPSGDPAVEVEPVQQLIVGARGVGAKDRIDSVPCPVVDESPEVQVDHLRRRGVQNTSTETKSTEISTDEHGVVRVLSPSRSSSNQQNRPESIPVESSIESVNGMVDDQIQDINLTWYNNQVIRIGAISESSIFHAILKAFYVKYANITNNTYERIKIVRKLRRDLALMLDQPDPSAPGRIYHQTIIERGFQTVDDEISRGVSFDFDTRLISMRNLINSNFPFPESLLDYVGLILGIGIVVLTNDGLEKYNMTEDSPIVVIFKENGEYQTVGIRMESGIQTVFYADSDFIQSL